MNQHTLPKAVWKTIVAVFLLMPLVVTVVYAFSARWVHILPEGFTLHYIAATLTNQKFLLGKMCIRDRQEKRITTFATTDLSRLGRNYLEVGLLQEKTFPTLGVRYIAVNDGYDSAHADTGSIDPSLFKNLMNDIYARDCSNKVLRAKRTLQRQGKYLGSAPYGYKLDPADKYHLVPDPDTAPVVQRIYALFLTGETRTHIAHLLMQEQVPCPARTKGMTGRRFTGEWTPTTIKRILTLPTYYGAVTQHTREMVSYKVHKARFLDSTDWIVVEGTHEGLVTKADFLQAQKLLETRSYTAPDAQAHRLTGLVYCADCGGKLFAHKVGGHFYLTCYTYSRRPGQHPVSYTHLDVYKRQAYLYTAHFYLKLFRK